MIEFHYINFICMVISFLLALLILSFPMTAFSWFAFAVNGAAAVFNGWLGARHLKKSKE